MPLATHPDKGGTPEAFRLVVEAFETLADPLRRAAYDLQLANAGAAREECRVAGPSGHDAKEAPPPAKRTSGEYPRSTPKKAKGKNGHATRATPGMAPGGKPSDSQPPEECKDKTAWVRELLGLGQRALRNVRIKSMAEEVLRLMI